MKTYVHNPEIYRRHFVGKALPHFQGQQIQRGYNPLFSLVKRVGAPLLKQGLKALAPEAAKIAKSLAGKAAKRAFPKSPMMQKVVNGVVTASADAAVRTALGRVQKKRKGAKSVSAKTKRTQKTRKRNIF